jgi:hypothetical protein
VSVGAVEAEIWMMMCVHPLLCRISYPLPLYHLITPPSLLFFNP